MTTGERVRQRMDRLGISQAELARRIGVAQPTIFKVVHDQTYASRHLYRVARELGTTPAYLVGETNDPEAGAPDEPELTYDERQLVDYFRALDRTQQQALLTLTMGIAVATPGATLNAPRTDYRPEGQG